MLVHDLRWSVGNRAIEISLGQNAVSRHEGYAEVISIAFVGKSATLCGPEFAVLRHNCKTGIDSAERRAHNAYIACRDICRQQAGPRVRIIRRSGLVGTEIMARCQNYTIEPVILRAVLPADREQSLFVYDVQNRCFFVESNVVPVLGAKLLQPQKLVMKIAADEKARCEEALA